MNGFCDLHCHLLYGLDDGAKTLEDTLEMARALVDLGFSTVAPSPHNRPEYAPNFFVSAAFVRDGIAQAGHDAHPFGHGQGRAAYVDGVAAGAQALGALHDGGSEPMAGQPVGEGGAGDAGAGDQHAGRGHARTISALNANLQ